MSLRPFTRINQIDIVIFRVYNLLSVSEPLIYLTRDPGLSLLIYYDVNGSLLSPLNALLKTLTVNLPDNWSICLFRFRRIDIAFGTSEM